MRTVVSSVVTRAFARWMASSYNLTMVLASWYKLCPARVNLTPLLELMNPAHPHRPSSKFICCTNAGVEINTASAALLTLPYSAPFLHAFSL